MSTTTCAYKSIENFPIKSESRKIFLKLTVDDQSWHMLSVSVLCFLGFFLPIPSALYMYKIEKKKKKKKNPHKIKVESYLSEIYNE